ncbi:GNAT family N-acetyltransferase [Cohnella terricola]|uniref:GNAT family N-acetyltransferase n=1 Tax=Cohnella terricola TaxID=1289167 RepID=UPI00164452E1|nr:GNAT family N-acetyltransferase [Cohnella terricola]
MFQYRDAVYEDFPLIASFPLNEDEAYYMFPSGSYPLDVEQLRLKAEERKSLTVVTDAGEVVGYGNLYDVNPGEDCWIGNVILRPSSRGTGAASYLIQTLINRAAEEHRVKTVRLVCHNTNTRALIFYSNLGFKPYDVRLPEGAAARKIVGIRMSIPVEGQVTL